MIQAKARLFFERFNDEEKLEERYWLKEVKSMYAYNIGPIISFSQDRFDAIFADKAMTIPLEKESIQKLIDDIEHKEEATWYAKKDGIPFAIKITWTNKDSYWRSHEHITITSMPEIAESNIMFYVLNLINICPFYHMQELTAEKK